MPDDNGITLAEAKMQLAAWLAADAAVAMNQSYRIDSGTGTSKTYTRADAAEIRKNLEYWETRVRRLASGGGIAVRGVTILG